MAGRVLRYGVVLAVMIGGGGLAGAQSVNPFDEALKIAAGCSAYEFDYQRAEAVAQTMGTPATAIPKQADELVATLIPNAPGIGDEPATLSTETCRAGYQRFGPRGTELPGLLKPRTRGSGIDE